MAAVWITCLSGTIKLERKPPGGVMDTNGGRFDLPPGRVLTCFEPHGGTRLITIEVIGAAVAVNGVTIPAGDKVKLTVTTANPATIRTA